jgi:AcrR family transcriptional regulator
MERGFADVSMQEIADAAGLRKASLYHHFKDKNALFTEIVLIEMRRLSDAISKRLEAGGDFRALIEEIAYAQFAQIRSEVVRLVTDYRQFVPETEHQEVHEELMKLAAVMQTAFELAPEQGVPLDIEPRVASLLFFHMVLALTEHAYDDPTLIAPDPRTAAKTVTKALLDGIIRR